MNGSIKRVKNEILLREVTLLLSEGKKVKFRAKGESMRPFIRGGEDLLSIEPTEELRKGDVVLAKIGKDGYVVHRIRGIKGDRFVLMGDGNLYETEECERGDISGVATVVIRKGKRISLNTAKSRLCALLWRSLLPLRRMKHFINNICKQLLNNLLKKI